MIFLVDVDGVIADFLGTLVDAIQARINLDGREAELGLVKRPHEWTSWGMEENLTPEQCKLGEEILTRTPFPSYVRPMPGAVDAVRQLRGEGVVYAVTAPWHSHPQWEKLRRDWLYKHFGVLGRHVVSASTKHIIDGDVLVDDKPDHVDAWKEHRRKTPVLFGHNYNANLHDKHATIKAWNADTVACVVEVARSNQR